MYIICVEINRGNNWASNIPISDDCDGNKSLIINLSN